MNKSTLTLAYVSKKFTQGNQILTVLHNIDIQFAQDQTYAITGASGSGKSTLMHIIAGIDSPSHGSVIFNTITINQLSPTNLSRHLNRSIGLVFQSPHLIAELSVLENVMLPGLIAQQPAHLTKKNALHLLERVGLAEKAYSNPKELSGGQQQRVALARALINKPAFLIADEPTGNLDLATGKKIIQLMLDCKKEWHMGIIISSHDTWVVEQMNEVYTLINGKLEKNSYYPTKGTHDFIQKNS